jgi:hypothetical protein
MKFKIFLAPFLFLGIHSGILSQCVNPAQIDPNVVCPMNYDPVCGCNGITYSNSCIAFYVGGVTSWTTGECGSGNNSCIDPNQIDSTIFCPTIYDPVCGCDSVTYSNSCVAQNYAGVTSWTSGPCQTQIQLADSCTNLAGIDFGVCAQFLGYGLINGQCTPISGCGTIVGNLDYAPALSPTLELCQQNCLTIIAAPSCSELTAIDFGSCTTPLGYGIMNNQCEMISGCSTVSGSMDYSSSFYSTVDSCQLCLSNGIESRKNEIKVYPTSVDFYLSIEVEDKFVGSEYQIISALGEIILTSRIEKTKNVISVDHLTHGLYILVLRNDIALYYRFMKN